MNKIVWALILILVLSCNDPTLNDVVDSRGKILVINGLAESFSIMDKDGNSIINDAQVTGVWPNHISYINNIYLTNSGSNSIGIYEASTMLELTSIYLGEGKNPWMVIPSEDEAYGYVPCYISDEVIKIEFLTSEIIATIPVGDAPEGGGIAGDYLFIGNTGDDSVSVIDVTTDSVVKTIDLTYESRKVINPQSVVSFPEAEEIHIICTGVNALSGGDDGLVIILNSNNFSVKDTIEVGGSPVFSEGSINYEDNLVYLYGTTGVYIYNYITYEVIDSGISGFYVSGLTYIPETNLIYISDFDGDAIKIYNGSDYSYEGRVQASDGPQQLLYIRE